MDRSPAHPARARRVAVIVPAYGVAHLVGEALASLQAQTCPDWTCVVIDDGAPDDVAGAVAPFLSDPRIRFLATDNRGVSAARNRAIAACEGEFVTLLDGDDLLRPGYLEAVLRAFDADPAARLVTCNARIFGAVRRERLCVDARQGSGDGVTGSLGDVLDRSFNVYIGSTFRRADWQALGGFDPGLSHCEDFDFWVRLMMLGGHARYIDAVLGEYRVRPGSASASAAKMIRGNLKVYEKALAALGEGPEAGIAHRMIAENHAELAFEEAVHQVADGDTARGLPALRAARRGRGSLPWALALMLWRLVPALAPPMLSWRRDNNARGQAAEAIPALHHSEALAS